MLNGRGNHAENAECIVILYFVQISVTVDGSMNMMRTDIARMVVHTSLAEQTANLG
jgi:hypothetical protein